jgi:predicted RNA binding protein YcfA (HicA-like mRNA interferase family)
MCLRGRPSSNVGRHRYTIAGIRLSRRPPVLDSYASAMKVSEVLRMLLDDGWSPVATRGSHRQFKHTTKQGRVTVPGKPSDDLAPGTLNSILKQAGLKK